MNYCKQYKDDIKSVSCYTLQTNKLLGKSIFITGANGLIGSAIADVLLYIHHSAHSDMHIMLAGRDKERMLQRFNAYTEGRDYTFVPYDATTFDIPNIPADYIIHAASNADPAMIASHPVETMRANIIGLDALFRHSSPNSRVLYVSSSEVYGRKSGTEPYREEDYGFVDLLNPRASYPSSKRAAETFCAAYGKEYSRDFVIVRPGHIYGPTAKRTDSRASSVFPFEVLDGKDIVMKSAGTQMRSYCYCLDCASAILSVLTTGASGNAYNISNRDSVVNIRQMAEAFAKSGGRKVVFDIPSEAEKMSYNLMDNSSLNAEKLESLGWHACFSMDEGAKHTLEILKAEYGK